MCLDETALRTFSYLDYAVALSKCSPCILDGPSLAHLVHVIHVLLSVPFDQGKKKISQRYNYIH